MHAWHHTKLHTWRHTRRHTWRHAWRHIWRRAWQYSRPHVEKRLQYTYVHNACIIVPINAWINAYINVCIIVPINAWINAYINVCIFPCIKAYNNVYIMYNAGYITISNALIGTFRYIFIYICMHADTMHTVHVLNVIFIIMNICMRRCMRDHNYCISVHTCTNAYMYFVCMHIQCMYALMHVSINAYIMGALMRMCIMFTNDQQYSVSITVYCIKWTKDESQRALFSAGDRSRSGNYSIRGSFSHPWKFHKHNSNRSCYRKQSVKMTFDLLAAKLEVNFQKASRRRPDTDPKPKPP